MSMTRWFIPALLAVILMCGGSIAINPADAAPAQAAAARQQHASKATDLSARRHIRHQRRYVYRRYYRPYDPYYYDRPYYYAPAPFFPFLGFGYGPWR
jgi:hypothetical protein